MLSYIGEFDSTKSLPRRQTCRTTAVSPGEVQSSVRITTDIFTVTTPVAAVAMKMFTVRPKRTD